ncbi:TRAP transporter small permease [Oscillospiraceae bacterium LTW-04]|nr:TRAP transporter small permease [Oscillospiraceae bacterium MB24-C1]
MKKIYQTICKAEESICGMLLCIIVALAFLTAIARCIKHPISWTNDISQLFLAWLAFLGADMALREGRVLGVDILTRRLPEKTQAAIRIATNVLLLLTLAAFVKYGFALCFNNISRSYQALGLSYSWATASLPVCSILMVTTITLETMQQFNVLTGRTSAVKERAK